MTRTGQRGSVVILGCDAGDRYADTCYDQAWLVRNAYDIEQHVTRLERFLAQGECPDARCAPHAAASSADDEPR
jgi:cysteine synthase A